MASIKEFPNFVRGAAALGVDRIRTLAEAKGHPLSEPGTPDELATRLLGRLKHAGDVGLVQPGDEDLVGVALGLGAREDWKSSLSNEQIDKLPFYLKPTYAREVYQVWCHRVVPERAALRGATPAPSQKASRVALPARGAWSHADGVAFARALADALGFEPAEPTREGFARVIDPTLALGYVAIPGGSFEMGLSPAEKRELTRRAKSLGTVAVEHARAIARQGAPVRTVAVAPFLVAESLLSSEQASRLGMRAAGSPARVDAEDAAEFVQRAGRRLPSEAEWEYLARARGSAWLCGDEDPATWIQHADQAAVWGIRDLAWGEWVDDGWHESYKGAPVDASAWEPRVRPELARSGAAALYPWQNPGERLLLHVASRNPGAGHHGVRLVIDFDSASSTPRG